MTISTDSRDIRRTLFVYYTNLRPVLVSEKKRLLDYFLIFKLQQFSSHLKAQTTAIEAALVHARVFADETLTEATFILEKEVAVAVVVKHTLSQVQQGPQLAKGVAVSLHFPGIVCYAKKDAPAVCCDIASFLDNVEKAAAHHL